jgi:hypothetical protein
VHAIGAWASSPFWRSCLVLFEQLAADRGDRLVDVGVGAVGGQGADGGLGQHGIKSN